MKMSVAGHSVPGGDVLVRRGARLFMLALVPLNGRLKRRQSGTGRLCPVHGLARAKARGFSFRWLSKQPRENDAVGRCMCDRAS